MQDKQTNSEEPEVENMGIGKQTSKRNIIGIVVVVVLLAIIGVLIKRSFAATRITNPYTCVKVNGSFPSIKVGSKDGDTGVSGEQCVSAVQWDMILSNNQHKFDAANKYKVTVTGTYSTTDKNEAIIMQKYFNWNNQNGEWGSYEMSVFNAFVPFKVVANSTPPPSTSYDAAVAADNPVGYWKLDEASGTAKDSSGKGLNGKYLGSSSSTTLPNGDKATVFAGKSGNYVQIPDADQLSIPTTKTLTWEAWVRPDVLQQPTGTDGYTDFLGKCSQYSPTCEWEGRIYNTTNSENRCNRVSAYVFNGKAGLGSAADWQPKCNSMKAGQWLHVVGMYQTATTPSDCKAGTSPGSIEIWVNGVQWNSSYHRDTGCMSQYSVKPQNLGSEVRVGTMADEYWFKGAVAKFAVYDHQLTAAQISDHYKAMVGHLPVGSCANDCTLNY